MPTDLPVKVIQVEAAGLRVGNLLKEAGLAASTSEANRKIDEGAVRIDGAKVTDRALTSSPGSSTCSRWAPSALQSLSLS